MIDRRVRWLFATLAASSLLAVASCSSGSDDGGGGRATRTVTATASGSAIGIPDNLTANISVSTRGTSAAEVLADNNTKAKALLDKLADQGIDAKDVSTTSVELGPTYDKDGEINGYAATNSLVVTLRDLDEAGTQLDAMVDTVGDAGRIGSIQLGFNDDDALMAEARADAVKRARAQAEEMAKADGVEVGEVQTITEVTRGGVELDALTSAAADSSVPIAAGSQELTVQVKAVFAIS